MSHLIRYGDSDFDSIEGRERIHMVLRTMEYKGLMNEPKQYVTPVPSIGSVAS